MKNQTSRRVATAALMSAAMTLSLAAQRQGATAGAPTPTQNVVIDLARKASTAHFLEVKDRKAATAGSLTLSGGVAGSFAAIRVSASAPKGGLLDGGQVLTGVYDASGSFQIKLAGSAGHTLYAQGLTLRKGLLAGAGLGAASGVVAVELTKGGPKTIATDGGLSLLRQKWGSRPAARKQALSGSGDPKPVDDGGASAGGSGPKAAWVGGHGMGDAGGLTLRKKLEL